LIINQNFKLVARIYKKDY